MKLPTWLDRCRCTCIAASHDHGPRWNLTGKCHTPGCGCARFEVAT